MISDYTECKVVLIGSVCVGKTCFVQRLNHDTFDEDYQDTIGGFLTTITRKVGDEVVKFDIWDTAGQERYRALTPVYSRDAAVVLVMYDITSNSSFNDVPEWIDVIKGNALPNCKVILLGAKADLASKRAVSLTEGEALKESIKASYFCEVSSKTGMGIGLALECITRCLSEAQSGAGQDYDNQKIEMKSKNQSGRSQCC